MSRCFAYPPAGYVKDGIRDEALIESIKLQREREKAKKESKKDRKKEKKREKKDKEKKEKDKAKSHGDVESKKRSHKKKRKHERNEVDKIAGDLKRRAENGAEQLEKSSLTEEHGNPVGFQNSPDSTLNSCKRQKLSTQSDATHNPGSIIRIKLPLQRHKDPEMVVQPSKEQPSYLSERTCGVTLRKEHSVPGSTLRHTKQKPGVSTLRKEYTVPGPTLKQTKGNPGVSTSCKEHIVPGPTLRQTKENPGVSTPHKEHTVPGSTLRQTKENPGVSISRREHTVPGPTLRQAKENPGVSTSCKEHTVPGPTLRQTKENPGVSISCIEHTPSGAIFRQTKEKPGVSIRKSESSSMLGETLQKPSLCSSRLPHSALKFRDLVENWVPPLVQSEFSGLGDQEWLFETKGNGKCEARRDRGDSVESCHMNSIGWPRVCYMPEADIYALPFTVPF